MSTQPEQAQPLPDAFAVPAEPATGPQEPPPLPVTMTQANPHPADVIYGLPLEPLPAVLVAVKVAGRDTVTFPAIRDEEPERCTCGMPGCPDRDRSQDAPAPAETRAVLSCGPGVVSRMWRARVQNGQWEDVSAAADAGQERIHKPARRTRRRIHNDLDCGWHDIAAIFRANPGILSRASNETFGRALAEVAASLEAGLAEMQRLSAERWGAKAVSAA